MSEVNLENVKAMIRLLDDPDTEIYDHISSELVAIGREVVPMLEEAWSGAFDPLLQERIENIIPFYAKWGTDLIKILYENSLALQQEMVILEET